MKVYQHEDKENKTKTITIEATSILQSMQDLEEYVGVTSDKIHDNWYELKRQLREVIVAQLQKDPAKKEDEKEKP